MLIQNFANKFSKNNYFRSTVRLEKSSIMMVLIGALVVFAFETGLLLILCILLEKGKRSEYKLFSDKIIYTKEDIVNSYNFYVDFINFDVYLI